MFNPEKILGGMLRSSSRGGVFGKPGKGAIGLGLLGVAMAAVEHFMEKTAAAQAGGGHPVPRGSIPSNPRPGSGAAVPPPPPPGATATIPPHPPGPAPSAASVPESDPVLLIRAMIAAGHADGHIDPNERAQILEKLKAVELTAEESSFVLQELLSPCSLEAIIQGVKTPEMAKQVYAVSLMAIEVDTDAERDYIRKLALGLGLDPSTRQDLHRELGIEGI